MNLLLIEDQDDFVQRVLSASGKRGITVRVPKGTPLERGPGEDGPVEEQLRTVLTTLDEESPIDLVLLDTDLSRLHKAWFSQSVFRQTCQELGIPVCRYSKGASATQIKRFRELRRLAIEGASAIWVPSATLTDTTLHPLMVWLCAIHQGFAALSKALQSTSSAKTLGPAGVLAEILEKPDLQADLLGYTAQNFFSSAQNCTNTRIAQVTPIAFGRLGWAIGCSTTC